MNYGQPDQLQQLVPSDQTSASFDLADMQRDKQSFAMTSQAYSDTYDAYLHSLNPLVRSQLDIPIQENTPTVFMQRSYGDLLTDAQEYESIQFSETPNCEVPDSTFLPTSFFGNDSTPVTSASRSLPKMKCSTESIGLPDIKRPRDDVTSKITETTSTPLAEAILSNQMYQLAIEKQWEIVKASHDDIEYYSNLVEDGMEAQAALNGGDANLDLIESSEFGMEKVKWMLRTRLLDENGNVPPPHPQAIRRREVLRERPMEFKVFKWSPALRERLKGAIMLQNREILLAPHIAKFQKLKKELNSCRLPAGQDFDFSQAALEEELKEVAEKIREINQIPPEDLCTSFVQIDFQKVAEKVLKGFSALDCQIQWLNHDHPFINKDPWSLEEEEKLLELVSRLGRRSWVKVCEELGTNRVPHAVFRKFQDLQKEQKITRWTKEEDQILLDAIKTHGVKNWMNIASCFEKRTGEQCLHRYKSLCPDKKGRWSKEEDEGLLEGVKLYGRTWNKVQTLVPGRSDVQCRERYTNLLDPAIKQTPFEPEEDERLRNAIAEFGEGKWSSVAKVVTSRTDSQCKRRWKELLKPPSQRKRKR